MKRFSVLLVILMVLPALLFAQTSKRDVNIRASDGANLKGTIYSQGEPGPGVLLLHQCNMDRKSWDGLATKLANEGIIVLTVDYRGYGESDGTDLRREVRREQRARLWPGDMEAVYQFLVSQRGVDESMLGAGGSSCGVDQALILSAKHPEIKTLVLLSGAVRQATLDHLTRQPGPSILGAASREDTRSAQDITRVLEKSANILSRLEMYQDAGHGIPMFAKEPQLEPTIVEWYRERLISSP